LKSGPKKGFYTWSQGKNNYFLSAPKLLINAELYDLVLTPPSLKKKESMPSWSLGSQFATMGVNVSAFIGLALGRKDIIVFRFIIEYSSLNDFGP
jgi:hypothetical protein